MGRLTLVREIVLRRDLDDARMDEVRAILREHNREANPDFMRELETSPAVPLVVFGLTERGEVAGGLIGETRGRWFKVHIVAVRRDRRRGGVGSRILRAAESEAIARGRDRVFLETLVYQAPEFYEACGYARRCELADWDSHGHAKFIYVKELGTGGGRTGGGGGTGA